ncbi:MAG: EscU/YscU/HrcU family type III secretion system export apparatus switch protein [Rubritepida sp.]|jgi:flagellar biosynthetic protein FlhB|nr:EscU/YscU/HrcU family type III secretion system export apparatus switch protein [Rubritepida sp.]
MAEQQEESAAERTEPASPRRIEKAREEGQVALSREAVGFATLLSASLAAAILLPGEVGRLTAALAGALSQTHAHAPAAVMQAWAWLFLSAAWPIAAAAVLGAVAATLLQTRGAVSLKLLSPELSKISPIAGVKRLFGAEGWLEFLRTCLKIGVVAAALWFVAKDLPGLATLPSAPPGAAILAAGEGVAWLLAATLAAFALLALLDVLLVRHRHLERLRMTRQEVREEMKEAEGDPMIRARLRQLRESKGRQRMMAAVPHAAVVITNPTHYAVALAYEPGQSAAPKLVAKGVDSMAARIREAAKAAGVPIVPDPPLARALHRLELDTEIPAEHWDAVARIIAVVLRRRSGP